MSSEVQEQSASYGLADLKQVFDKASGNNTLLESLPVWLSAQTAKSAGRGRSADNTHQYGVQKLRELILELAVRGKLVEQDPNDEPASVLLEKIASEKNRLILEGKIKNQKLESLDDLEKLPSGWVWVRLGAIAYPQAGFAFKSNNFNQNGNGLPLIRIRDVGQKFSGTFYDGEYREEFIIDKGDYLVSMDGIFRVASSQLDKSLLNQRVTRLIFFSNSIAKRYIAESLQFQLSALQGVKAYTTVDHLSGKQITNSLIALPPEKEQHRIVKKVDELMALCDKLEQQQADAVQAHDTLVKVLLAPLTQSDNADDFQQNWRRIAEHFDTLFTTESSIDQLKQTLLQLAVMGKLVPQEPDDEPASILLEKIAEEKAKLVNEGKIKKQKSVAEITEKETQYELPNSWEWVRFAQISHKITDGAHHTPTYVNSGVPFLSVKDMSSGKLSFDDTRFISQEEHEELFKRCDPEKGDLLLTKVGTTGIPVLIRTEQEFSIFVSVALIKFNQTYISGDYLEWLISSPLIKEQSDAGTEGVGNKNLVLRKIANFLLPIPPLAEQRRIVKKVDELMAMCDQLKDRLNQVQTLQQQLANAVVAEAVG